MDDKVTDKVKSNKTKLVRTNSDVKNVADDQVKDKVKSHKTKLVRTATSRTVLTIRCKDKVKSDKNELVTTNSDVKNGAGDKVQW